METEYEPVAQVGMTTQGGITMRRFLVFKCLSAVCLSICLLALPAEGKPGGKKAGSVQHPDSDNLSIEAGINTSGFSVSLSIGQQEARRLAVEHNIVGYDTLPPGIRKNMAKGKPLPPGIAKKMVPGPMLAELPAHPGHEWRMMGADLILVEIASEVIAEVLVDVFR